MRALALALLCALPAAACGHVECAIDTDCPNLGSTCDTDTHTCIPLYASDAGGHDAGAMDAGPHDAATEGGPGDAAADAGGDMGGPAHTLSGAVYAGSAADLMRTDYSATFSDYATTRCTTRMDGSCTVSECPAGSPMPTKRSAGTITLVSGSQMQMLTAATDGTYSGGPTTMPGLWSAGAMVDVMADGADVPTFTLHAAGPGTVMLTAPSLMSPFALPRSTDQSITWSPGSGMPSGAKVVVSYAWSDASSGASEQVLCQFDASSGSGTVPATAMSVLPMGMTGTYTFVVWTQSSTMVGSWPVQLTLATYVTSSSGAATGSVMFM